MHLTGWAQKALHHLPEALRETYKATQTVLKACFNPESRETSCQAGLQTWHKKASEGWADFSNDLRALDGKAYPAMQDEAHEKPSINTYLQQLTQFQVALSVEQKRPETLDDAMAATFEMESYMALSIPVAIGSTL